MSDFGFYYTSAQLVQKGNTKPLQNRRLTHEVIPSENNDLRGYRQH